MSIKEMLFGKKPTGSPVRVMGESENEIDIVNGLVIIRKEGGITISYRWIDGTEHDYITDKKPIGRNQGLPLYAHNVGEIYQTTTPHLITSEYWNSINNSHIGTQITTDTKELREGGIDIPWKKILIIGGVLIIMIVLWQNGFIQRIIKDVVPTGDTITPSQQLPNHNNSSITPIEPAQRIGN